MIANCRECGALFNRVTRDICPACVKLEQARFEAVRTYLSQHRNASMVEVVRETEVLIEEIATWIEEGRLQLIEFPNATIDCRGCGIPTQDGMYCANCRNEMIMELAGATEHVRRLREGAHSQQVKFHTRTDGTNS